MADKNADQIKASYVELAKIAPSQDWERILKVAKKILGFSVNEKKAFQTKVVCLIHLGKFDEALSSIERNHDDTSELLFERAYCEYRMHKIEDAYATLLKCKQMTNKEKELLAQITYRLERYEESYDIYKDLVKNVYDDFDNERQTNLSAVVASMQSPSNPANKELDMSELEENTFELCYNSACISLGRGDFATAEKKLVKAEDMCVKTIGEDPEELENLDDEAAIVRVQLAYCLHKMDKTDEALKIYNNVLKIKPSDASVIAVASNNLVCINKDQNVFDSKKRLKMATSAELEQKLNTAQRRKIAFNEILFAMNTNQRDAAHKLVEQFKEKFSGSGGALDSYALLKVAQLFKEKKFSDAERVLAELPAATNIQLYLLHVLLAQSKVPEAIELIKRMAAFAAQSPPRLGIVSALVTLLKSRATADKAAAAELTALLNGLVDKLTQSSSSRTDDLHVCVRANANYQLELGNLQAACDMLERMRALKPKDFRILSKLINVYSRFDADKAKQLSAELPSLEDIVADSSIDIDELEAQFASSLKSFKIKAPGGGGGLIKSPLLAKAKAQQSDAGQQLDEAKKKDKKKKKKRKIRLPKQYDPNGPIDAERWLPLRERSYYRGKRNKKKGNLIGKGTQGAVSSSAKESTSNPATPKPDTSAVKAPKPPASAISKKKKKAGPKW